MNQHGKMRKIIEKFLRNRNRQDADRKSNGKTHQVFSIKTSAFIETTKYLNRGRNSQESTKSSQHTEIKIDYTQKISQDNMTQFRPNPIKVRASITMTYVDCINETGIYGYQSKRTEDHGEVFYYTMGNIIVFYMAHPRMCNCSYCNIVKEAEAEEPLFIQQPQVAIRTPANTTRPRPDEEQQSSSSSRQPLSKSQEESFLKFLVPIIEQQERNVRQSVKEEHQARENSAPQESDFCKENEWGTRPESPMEPMEEITLEELQKQSNERWESPESHVFERITPKPQEPTRPTIQHGFGIMAQARDLLDCYNSYPNIRSKIYGKTPTIRKNFNRATMQGRVRHYKYICDGMAEIFPLNDVSKSYGTKYMEFNLWQDKCEHGTGYHFAETYCPSCDTKKARLDEYFKKDLEEARRKL